MSENAVRTLPSPWELSVEADHVVEPSLCGAIVARIDDAADAVERIDIDGDRGARRLVTRLNVTDANLASLLFERLRPVLPQRLVVDPLSGRCSAVTDGRDVDADRAAEAGTATYDAFIGPLAGGVWALSGVDPRINIYRYPSGGVFSKHRDAPRYTGIDTRSFYSVIVYLNDGYEGGCTTIFADDESQAHSVQPRAGRAFAMSQRTLHQGSEVLAGFKEILRCDVMYQRLPVPADGEADNNALDSRRYITAAGSVRHLDKTRQALQWRDLGLALEASQVLSDAVACYQRAAKLDPDISLGGDEDDDA